ncbi:MAG: hypothetical protein JRE47_03910 [Deltaproteobacteria bacterium]|nr:hypothetical protein [Deltaproteobacteria bacterium]
MTTVKEALSKIGPNSIVDLRVRKGDDLDSKDDLRKTRILDITDSYIILEQPTPKINSKSVGTIMGITYIKRDERGKLSLIREILEAKLIKIGEFKFEDSPTEALFFERPFNVYSASMRRHFRVKVPFSEDAFVEITDLRGHAIGARNRYRIIDLSLQGLKFMCEKKIETKEGSSTDPVSLFSIKDEILTKIFVDQQELLWTKSIIAISLISEAQEGNVLYFGVEFIQGVANDNESERIEFYTFTDRERSRINPYITDLQRKALRKERFGAES